MSLQFEAPSQSRVPTVIVGSLHVVHRRLHDHRHTFFCVSCTAAARHLQWCAGPPPPPTMLYLGRDALFSPSAPSPVPAPTAQLSGFQAARLPQQPLQTPLHNPKPCHVAGWPLPLLCLLFGEDRPGTQPNLEKAVCGEASDWPGLKAPSSARFPGHLSQKPPHRPP